MFNFKPILFTLGVIFATAAVVITVAAKDAQLDAKDAQIAALQAENVKSCVLIFNVSKELAIAKIALSPDSTPGSKKAALQLLGAYK